jgi:hypothetical protein
MLKWLLLMAINLIDDNDDDSNVHVFIDKSADVIKCQDIWIDIVTNSTTSVPELSSNDIGKERNMTKEKIDRNNYINKLSKIHISPISDIHLQDKDTILVIFNPDNQYACEHPHLLEDVQALCFHAALRKIPVVLINPQLMATGSPNVN